MSGGTDTLKGANVPKCIPRPLLANSCVGLSESGPPRPYPVLDFRFLFAYDSVSFQGPMVRHHELTHRVNAHGETRRPDSVDIARPGIHHSLRLSRNAATLALLPSENIA